MKSLPIANEMFAAQLAGEIRAEMAYQRKTQVDLAKVFGVTPQAVGAKLRGESRISIDDLERISSALGLTALDLLARAERRQAETGVA